MCVMIYDRLAFLSCMCSYRRVGGSDFAQLLKVCFQKVGVDVFLDVDNLGQCQFDEQLWKRINAAKNIVLVWTKGCRNRGRRLRCLRL
jgi:hypothetical protein